MQSITSGANQARQALAPASAAVLARDLFTDTDTTNLTAHTMDIGAGWVAKAGIDIILSNRASAFATSAAIYTTDVSRANVRVRALVSIPGTTGSVGLAVRLSDTSNYWFTRITGTQFAIFEVNAGTTTSRAATTITAANSTQYELVFRAVGTTLSATFNGDIEIGYGSAALNSTATLHGLRGATLVGITWDEFEVTAS